MRKIIALLFVSCSALYVSAQYAQDSAWIKDHYYKMERYIPMRDGVKLFTTIYMPKDTAQKHPILLTRTPYSCAPYGEANFNANLWNRHWRYYARENYIIVTQDVRGRCAHHTLHQHKQADCQESTISVAAKYPPPHVGSPQPCAPAIGRHLRNAVQHHRGG